MPLNTCKFSIEFYFNAIEHQSMAVEIWDNGVKDAEVSTEGTYVYTKEITLPTKIILKFKNKNPNDTIVDESGKITKDKSVVIQNMSLDNLPISVNYIRKHLKLITENQQEIYSHYIGFNGDVELDFDRPNVFLQLMKFNRLT